MSICLYFLINSYSVIPAGDLYCVHLNLPQCLGIFGASGVRFVGGGSRSAGPQLNLRPRNGSSAWFASGTTLTGKPLTVPALVLRTYVGSGVVIMLHGLSATSVYYLDAEQLRFECSARGLSTGGDVRDLRRRLAEFIKSDVMDGVDTRRDEQASESGEVVNTELPPASVAASGIGLSVDRSNHTSVLVDLLKQIPPLLSERPEDILGFFVRLGEIHTLGLVEDRIFITRILPLLSQALLQFLAECLRDKSNWPTCKTRVLEEYFPHFVRERLIRNLIVFNFTRRERQYARLLIKFFGQQNFCYMRLPNSSWSKELS